MEVDQIGTTLWEVSQALEREEAANRERGWDQGLERVQRLKNQFESSRRRPTAT
jgi:hypothetical protein